MIKMVNDSDELHTLGYADVVKKGIELELDAVVQGKPLHKRVDQIMQLALNWAAKRRAEAKDYRIGARRSSVTQNDVMSQGLSH